MLKAHIHKSTLLTLVGLLLSAMTAVAIWFSCYGQPPLPAGPPGGEPSESSSDKQARTIRWSGVDTKYTGTTVIREGQEPQKNKSNP